MKAIGKCEVCGGKIIQAGNGNIFCEDCADKNFGETLQAWADRKEKQRMDWRTVQPYNGRRFTQFNLQHK